MTVDQPLLAAGVSPPELRLLRFLANTIAGDRPAFSTASVREYEVNGVTWWIQGADTVAKMRNTILRGPPA